MDATRPASKFGCVLGYPGPLPCRGCPPSCPEHPEAARPASGQYDEWDVYSLQARVADLETENSELRDLYDGARENATFYEDKARAAEAQVAALRLEIDETGECVRLCTPEAQAEVESLRAQVAALTQERDAARTSATEGWQRAGDHNAALANTRQALAEIVDANPQGKLSLRGGESWEIARRALDATDGEGQ